MSVLAAIFVAPACAGDAFVLDEVADGVHVARPTGTSPERVNSLVVEREDGLLIAGAQPSPAAARELLAAVKPLGRPVRYLVLPHSHADAAGGASAFPESVLVIGNTEGRQALEDEAYDFGAEARTRAGDEEQWSEPPRRLPTLVVAARTVLADPRNSVEFFSFSSGHSPGDMIVHVQPADVFFLGSLLFPDRAPYGGDGRIASWLSGLSQFVKQSPRVMVPLRGESVTVTELRKMRDDFAWLVGQIEAGLSDGLAPSVAAERALAAEGLSDRFDVDSPNLRGLVERAATQAAERRAKFYAP